jgi:hypothetical protein
MKLTNSGRSAVSIILIVLVLFLILGGLPQFGYHNYGYGPSGFGTVLLIVLIVVLLR